MNDTFTIKNDFDKDVDLNMTKLTDITVSMFTSIAQTNLSVTKSLQVMALGILASQDKERIDEFNDLFKQNRPFYDIRSVKTKAKYALDNLPKPHTIADIAGWTVDNCPINVSSIYAAKPKNTASAPKDKSYELAKQAIANPDIDTGAFAKPSDLLALLKHPATAPFADEVLQKQRNQNETAKYPKLTAENQDVIFNLVTGYIEDMHRDYPDMLAKLEAFQLNLLTAPDTQAEDILAA